MRESPLSWTVPSQKSGQGMLRATAMAFVAEAFVSLDVSPEVAFDTLADHPSWKDWMPRSFAPISKADGPLRAGTKIKMRVAGTPATIEVTIVDRAKEIQWCG